jgi:general secretion pathway protein C
VGLFLKKYTWVIYLFLIFLGTYFLAKTASDFIASKIRIQKKFQATKVAGFERGDRKIATFDDYRIILERNIFDSRELGQGPEEGLATAEPQEVNLEGPAVKTTLSIKLISTFSVGEGTDKRSSATIEGGEKGGSQANIYAIEDEKQFAPGVKITKILPDRVEFINGPRLEYVEIEDFGGGISTGRPTSAPPEPLLPAVPNVGGGTGTGVQEVTEGKFLVDRAEINNAIESLDQLFTQVRAVPQFKDGKAAGLKLLSIRSGSLFAKLGLRRNDILEQINGQPVDMKRGVEIFGQLKDANQISIDLVRDGKKTTLQYEIQ